MFGELPREHRQLKNGLRNLVSVHWQCIIKQQKPASAHGHINNLLRSVASVHSQHNLARRKPASVR